MINNIYAILDKINYPNKDIFLDILRHNGFQVLSVNSKVREMSKYLLKQKEDGSDAIIDAIRKKGYSVNSLFWINLIMTSNKISNNVIIEDLWEQDLYQNYIKLISLEKNEKYGIIYPDTIDVKTVEKWLKTL